MSENTVKHQPKCPICNVIGLEFITQQDSKMESKGGDPWFNVVHCSECGHVYGVFNKVSLSPPPHLEWIYRYQVCQCLGSSLFHRLLVDCVVS